MGETTGLTVDRGRRNDVVSFWHCIHAASEGYEDRMGWTGSYSGCFAGTTSRAYQDDVQRRVNFMRALAGLPADTLVNDGTTIHVDSHTNAPAGTLRSEAAQAAAHMMARSRLVNHVPPPGTLCYSSIAGNGCFRSSLAYSFHGPGAIDEYMRETDEQADIVWSIDGGHRRWILYPGATVFATGDTPGGPGVAATNVLYCVPTDAELAEVPAGFTAWPAAGCFPDRLNSRLWSLSHPDADFSQAAVSMTGPSGPVSVVIRDQTNTAYGDPAIVWEVPASVASSSVAADTDYQVAVTGIQGAGAPSSHSYEVTIIDPDTINEPCELVGTAAPPTTGARYAFETVDLADDHVVDISQLAAAGWTEGAEDNPAPQVIDGTSPQYELRAAVSATYYGDFWRSGSKAFRLAFGEGVNPPTEDDFELDRELVTGSSPQLSFYYRRGLMASGTKLRVETTVDGGLSWQTAGSTISGTNGYVDGSFIAHSVPLPANESAVRVRIRYDWNGGGFYWVSQYPTQPVGIFIDDISVSGVEELQSVATLNLGAAASELWLDSATLGQPLLAGEQYRLRMRAVMGCHEFPYGPTRQVTVTGSPLGGFAAWKEYEQPLLVGGFDDDDDSDGQGNGTEYAFGSNPLDRATPVGVLEPDLAVGVLRLRRSLAAVRSDVEYAAEWSPDMSNWSTSGITVTIGGGEVVAEVGLGGDRRFLRWRISQL